MSDSVLKTGIGFLGSVGHDNTHTIISTFYTNCRHREDN